MFPAKTSLIGNSCFEGCSTLESVSAAADLQYLVSVLSHDKNGQDDDGNQQAFKQIGDYAFYKCTNLKNFDFDYFTQIERIGHYAFSMAGESNGVINATGGNTNHNACICENGVVELPASITNIGVGAFNSSKIKSVTIKSSSLRFERGKSYANNESRTSVNSGCHTFRQCSELTKVFFSDPDCEWRTVYLLKTEDGQDNTFSDCKKLTEIYMPTGYDIQYPRYTAPSTDDSKPRPDSMVWGSNNAQLKFYLYHTVKVLDDSKPAISIYWRRVAGGNVVPIVFYAGKSSDISELNGSTYVEIRAGTLYWTIYNGTPVYLGTATVNPTNGDVTFQTAGYTANSSGIQHS